MNQIEIQEDLKKHVVFGHSTGVFQHQWENLASENRELLAESKRLIEENGKLRRIVSAYRRECCGFVCSDPCETCKAVINMVKERLT
jgi:hypothetical protein